MKFLSDDDELYLEPDLPFAPNEELPELGIQYYDVRIINIY